MRGHSGSAPEICFTPVHLTQKAKKRTDRAETKEKTQTKTF